MILTQIAGHLGTDPETRFAPSGQKIITLRVATNVRRQNKDKTVWWRATIFGDRYDRMLPYLKKGSAVILVGTMNPPEIYQDKEGNSQVSLELIVEFMTFSPFGNKSEKSSQEGQGGFASQESDSFQPVQSAQSPKQQFQPRSFGLSGVTAGNAKSADADFSDDDIPF